MPIYDLAKLRRNNSFYRQAPVLASFGGGGGGGGGGTGSCCATYTMSFQNSDLTLGLLAVTHNMGSQYVDVAVYDDNDEYVVPGAVSATSTNVTTIDLSSYGTIANTWHAVIFAPSSGCGGGGSPSCDCVNYWISTTAGSIFTSGSAAFVGPGDEWSTGANPIDSPQDKGADVFFYVSGSMGCKDTATPGLALFGGDVAISGTLYGGSPLKIAGGVCVTGSLSQGENAQASANSSHAQGYYTIAEGNYSHAQGSSTTAEGTASHSEGSSTIATGNFSHAEGQSCESIGQGSHAEGEGTIARGDNSHTEGEYTKTFGIAAHAEGTFTTGSGNFSHAEGGATLAIGDFSHVEGIFTTGSIVAHAEGWGSSAGSVASHAEGYYTLVDDSSDASHAEGYYSYVQASNASHAEGYYTKISEGSDYSHTEGWGTLIFEGSKAAHAEGFCTTGSANYAHAQGSGSVASGVASHAGGINTKAAGEGQTVFGKYNESGNVTSLFVVGDGLNESNRHDVFRVNSGSVEVTGTLKVVGSFYGVKSAPAGDTLINPGDNFVYFTATNATASIVSEKFPTGAQIIFKDRAPGGTQKIQLGGTNSISIDGNTTYNLAASSYSYVTIVKAYSSIGVDYWFVTSQ